jgi:hypothetical protein
VPKGNTFTGDLLFPAVRWRERAGCAIDGKKKTAARILSFTRMIRLMNMLL